MENHYVHNVLAKHFYVGRKPYKPWQKHLFVNPQTPARNPYKSCRLWIGILVFSRYGAQNVCKTISKTTFRGCVFAMCENIEFPRKNQCVEGMGNVVAKPL